jgi:hypothetical protein
MDDAAPAPHAENIAEIFLRIREFMHDPLPHPFAAPAAGIVARRFAGERGEHARIVDPEHPAASSLFFVI